MDIPEPDPALVLIAVALRAFMKRLSKKERAAFAADMTRDLMRLDTLAAVISIRGEAFDKASAEARHQALAWWESTLAVIEATF